MTPPNAPLPTSTVSPEHVQQVADALMAAGLNGVSAKVEWDGIRNVIAALRSLSVEQRMEAMGMDRVEDRPEQEWWQEADPGFVYDPDEILDGEAIVAAAEEARRG